MNATRILLNTAGSFGFWLGHKQRTKRKYPDYANWAFADGAAWASLNSLQLNMPKSRALRRKLGQAIATRLALTRGTTTKAA